MLTSDLLGRLDLLGAVKDELLASNRLLPKRPDHLLLATDATRVERWLRPRIRKGVIAQAADVVFADKGWRGTRPLNVMSLEHRVLYQALVKELAAVLPAHLTRRTDYEAFQRAPLMVDGAAYISKTDVASCYVYIDHDVLADELISQTGDELAVDALRELLALIMGRRVGLPQIHQASRVLGDSYVDPVRRTLRRNGIAAFTYSDDFRFASPSLGRARSALTACEAELRVRGLVLNERKTYTYARDNYEDSLSAYERAEQNLFSEGSLTAAEAGLLEDDYEDEEAIAGDATVAPMSLGVAPIGGAIDDDELIEGPSTATATADDDIDQISAAAQKAWRMWTLEEESEEVQSSLEATITQSLISRALPVLGQVQDSGPLEVLSALFRYEAGLAPQIASYLINFCSHGPSARAEVRDAIDAVLSEDLTNVWQEIWIAFAIGSVRRTRTPGTRTHLDWLQQCVADGPDGLAATAAATLGRLQYGEPDLLAAAVDRIAPEWRQLALLGLYQLDSKRANESADHELDRILLQVASH
ncbi:RNA-directed DNA polymerase [Candidatus Mycobacterium wuenschmannii]|uniref:RNA-directed DNA polymerase n=1 Tax=Candidatus Mycobacterium wuenschmannii TaxID=3027808 RepID=A0ABY8VX77_9MYCO|nr:RNA-directed DNA polymerase [Candidatus Mycobacterium wuenschmannii]WIM87404.1 RNA-directed DNA polymerase [Candidatus Mycobacterium wuenschmannii]